MANTHAPQRVVTFDINHGKLLILIVYFKFLNENFSDFSYLMRLQSCQSTITLSPLGKVTSTVK